MSDEEPRLPKEILETYAGRYAELFVYLGTTGKPISMTLIEPILGIVMETEEDTITLFKEHHEICEVNLADPYGVELIESKISEILLEYHPIIADGI